MRPDCLWLRVLRAWTALAIVVAHLLLALSSNVTRAATEPAEHGTGIQDIGAQDIGIRDIGTQDIGTMLCLPRGNVGSPEAPAKPAQDHHNDCCTSCVATGPVALPAPFLVGTAIPMMASASVIRYAAPFILDTIDFLPSFARAPPAAA